MNSERFKHKLRMVTLLLFKFPPPYFINSLDRIDMSYHILQFFNRMNRKVDR